MSRLDRDGLIAAALSKFGGETDPTGVADVVAGTESIVVAADQKALKDAFKRAKKIKGYPWVMINRQDLFAANPLSLGSRAGLYDASGAVLKAGRKS